MIDPQEEGESDRMYLGIDGTMADAQDVDHPFVRALGGHCATCGLAESYRRHRACVKCGGPLPPLTFDVGPSHNAAPDPDGKGIDR